MTPEQRTVAGITMADSTRTTTGSRSSSTTALTTRSETPPHALTLTIAAFRPLFDDASWQALLDDGRGALLELEAETT